MRPLLAFLYFIESSVSVSKPFKLHTLLLTRDTGSLSSAGSDNSVQGMCSMAQDSISQLIPASSSGISTISQCAQYAKESTENAVYVTFSASEDTCMWFTECQCIVTGSTCLGGTAYASAAIIDIIQTSPNVIQTTAAPDSNSAIVVASSETTNTTTQSLSTDPECDTTSSDLMQYFQSKCEMNQNMWASRLVSLGMVVVVLSIFVTGFCIAFWFDKRERNKVLEPQSSVTSQ